MGCVVEGELEIKVLPVHFCVLDWTRPEGFGLDYWLVLAEVL